MNAVRKVYESLPEIINTPAVLKKRRAEVIMLPPDEDAGVKKMKPPLKNLSAHGRANRLYAVIRANLKSGSSYRF
jgi:hypothetical protein